MAKPAETAGSTSGRLPGLVILLADLYTLMFAHEDAAVTVEVRS